jgi:hypothetical protein
VEITVPTRGLRTHVDVGEAGDEPVIVSVNLRPEGPGLVAQIEKENPLYL